MTLLRPPSAALLVALLAACGGDSDEQRLMDRMGARCDAFAAEGRTIAEADSEMSGVGFVGFQLDCRGDLLSLPADTCGPVSPATRVCQFYWYWRPTDADACERGCCACQARVTEADQLASRPGEATICASRFERPSSCPF